MKPHPVKLWLAKHLSWYYPFKIDIWKYNAPRFRDLSPKMQEIFFWVKEKNIDANIIYYAPPGLYLPGKICFKNLEDVVLFKLSNNI